MSSKPLPTDRLTISEWLFVISMHVQLFALALVGLGAIMCLPWVFVAVVLLIVVQRNGKRKHAVGRPSDVHGRAHFSSEQEAAAAGFAGNAGLILGKMQRQTVAVVEGAVLMSIVGTRMSETATLRALIERYVKGKGRNDESSCVIRLPASDKYSHVACYLPSGAGKTWGHLIPNLFDSDENAVVYDPSGEAYREAAAHRRHVFAHATPLIDPFGVCGVPSDRLNVLDLVGAEDPAGFDFARNLARAMVPEKANNSQEPFWHSATVAATEFLIYMTMRCSSGEVRNVRTLGELLSGERFHDLSVKYSTHPDEPLRRRAMQMSSFEGRTLPSLIGCLASEHGWLDSPTYARVLSESTFDLRDLYRKKQTIFLVIPGHRTVESQPFIRMVLTAILFTGFESGPDIKRRPVRFYLDECATLGRLDQLMALYTQGRKYGMRSVSYFQSLGQVAEIMGTPERVHTFRSNMAAEIIKAKDFQSAKETSEWIGQKTIQTLSQFANEGTNTGWSNSYGNQVSRGQSGGANESAGLTIAEQGAPLIRPEEILQLGPNQAFVLAAGTPPIKVNIIPATEAAACGKLAKGGDKSYLRSVRLWSLFNACAAVALALIAVGLMIGASRF